MTATSKEQSKSKKEKHEPKKNNTYVMLGILIVIVIVGIAVFLLTRVSFSTFYANFNKAQRVAIVVTQSSNITIYDAQTSCYTAMIQDISSHRAPSTIDFYIIGSNNTCTYAPNGLGHVLNPLTSNSTTCLSMASKEPGIYMSYSPTNYTSISEYSLHLYGNEAYYNRCAMAVELS